MVYLNRFLKFKKLSFWRYVILKGVIVWGGGMFLFFLMAQYFFSFPNESILITKNWIIKNGLLWAIIGFFWGVLSWEKNGHS